MKSLCRLHTYMPVVSDMPAIFDIVCQKNILSNSTLPLVGSAAATRSLTAPTLPIAADHAKSLLIHCPNRRNHGVEILLAIHIYVVQMANWYICQSALPIYGAYMVTYLRETHPVVRPHDGSQALACGSPTLTRTCNLTM